MPFRKLAAVLWLIILISAPTAMAISRDDNVEWNGVSHVPWQDRRPLCPIDGESFSVRFQTYAGDITAARLYVDDGAGAWIDATEMTARGPYTIWAAQVPATAATALSYYIELTDGADTDYLSAGGVSDDPPADQWFTVDFATLAHAPVGATPVTGGGTVFKVWTPASTSVHVRGQFNSWGLANPLNQVGEHFIAHVANATDRQQYKYFFDNSHWNTDARAKSLNAGDNYNAHIESPFRYSWQIQNFDTPDFEQMVIYQLHVGTFAGRNDPYGAAPFPSGYADVAARVAHLAELGINAVMLNPINEFPGDLSAGYNPVSQWAPEWKYGDPDDLKAMVDALHEHGIAVLLDIVWNHFSFSDNFMWNYDGTQLYFDDPAVETPWGSQADFDRDGVRDYYASSALYWLEEFKMDGFRMDATSFMNIPPQDASGWSLMQRLNNELDNRWIDKITIAEQLPDDAWITRPSSLGGAGFDAQYYDVFTDRLREEIFDAALGDPEMFKIRGITYGGGDYLQGRQVVNYVELHDEAWPSSGGQRIVKTIDTTPPHDDMWAKGRVKLAQGVVLTAPGIPAILMGTEWLEDTDFGTDFGNRIDWSKKATYAPIFEYFRDLIHLRTLNPALRADSGHQVFHLNEGGNVMAWQRWHAAGDVLVVVANFSNIDYSDYRIGLPQPGQWREVLNSQSAQYDGNGLTNPGLITAEDIAYDLFDQSAALSIPQMGLLVFARESEVSVQDEPPVPGRPQLLGAHPNPFNPRTSISFRLDRSEQVRIAIYDLAGRQVTVVADRVFAPGTHSIQWNGADSHGRAAGTGGYLVRMRTTDAEFSRKVMLVR